MTKHDIPGNVTDNLKGQWTDKLDPGKVLSEGNLKKKRGAFWTCLLIGLLLIVLSFGVALALNVTRLDLLKQGVDTHVVGRGIVSQADADAFVNDTLDYLTGIKTLWEPAVTIGGFRIGVPETFKTHMATVKGWVDSAKAVLLGCAAIVLLLLTRALIGVKGSKKSPFSTGGYYLGAFIPLALLVGLGLWGYFDFDGFWAWIHRAFIPDGIFSAMEPIMQLFPVEVFSGYLQPIATTFAICTGITLLLPLLLWPLSRLLTAVLGSSAGTGRSQRKRTGTRKPSNAQRTTRRTTSGKTGKQHDIEGI